MNFSWEGTPLFLAPMAGVTDLPFRRICKSLGAQVLVSEMISTRGIYYEDKKTKKLLTTRPEEGPIGLQLFGNSGEFFIHAIEKLQDLSFDFFDINMGCPTPKIVKNGDGCALMRDLDLAFDIMCQTVKASQKPVTVKIRKGWDDDEINALDLALKAEEAGVSAIAVHGRTRAQFYRGKADWDILRQVKEEVGIPVVGNGDVASPQDAKKMKEMTNCDGIMIGRAALGNPWIFRQVRHFLDRGQLLPPPDLEERLATILLHMKMALEFHGDRLGMLEMRKHLAWYIKGLPHSARVKESLQDSIDPRQVQGLLQEYFASLKAIT